MDVFDHHAANRPERAGADEVPGFLHHRVAGVVVGQAEDEARFVGKGCELPRFGEVEGGWLVGPDVKASLERGLGDREVGVIGGGDDDEIHALARGPARFGLEHLRSGAVTALRRQPVERWPGTLRPFRIAGEDAAGKLDAPVEFRRDAMHRTGEGALAATDKPHASFAIASLPSIGNGKN